MRLSFLQKTEVISTCTLKGIIISHSTSERNSKQSSVYQPMNWKRFKLDMFETMRRNLPLLLQQSFGVGRAVAPLRCRMKAAKRRRPGGPIVWGPEGDLVTPTLSCGLQASQFQALWSSGFGSGPLHRVPCPSPDSSRALTLNLHSVHENNTDTAGCFLCVCMSACMCTFIYK